MTGLIRGFKGPSAPKEADDTLFSKQHAQLVDLISEGEIVGLVNGHQSIFLDDTPLMNDDGTYNFNDVVVETREGTQDQTHIDGLNGSESEVAVGVEITTENSIVRTILSQAITHVRLTLSVPTLLTQDGDGDINGARVTLQVDVQSNGNGYVTQYGSSVYTKKNWVKESATQVRNSQVSTRFKIPVVWKLAGASGSQSISYDVQYRPYDGVSNPAWTTFKSEKKSASRADGSQGLSSYVNPMTSQTTEYEIVLASGTYQFRIVKTGGTELRAGVFGFGYTGGSVASGRSKGGTVTIKDPLIYVPSADFTIKGKTTSKYQRGVTIPLTGEAPWNIRVRRITPDPTSSKKQNKTFWDSYTEIVDAKLTYPNSAIVMMRMDAEQFDSIPTRAYHIKGMKVLVPDNYNPDERTYTGVWSGTFKTAWTNNPAWIFYDLVLNNRYGLGEFVDQAWLSKWMMYQIAQYCDEPVPDGYGGSEPRFACNVYLQDAESAYTVLNNLASVFRSMVYQGSSQIMLSQDKPGEVKQIFHPSNVVDGMFSYSGSAGQVRYNNVLVTWNDLTVLGRPQVEYVEDVEDIAKHGVIKTEVVGIACTSRGQARRLGRSILYTNLYESETVMFQAGFDAVYVGPGDIIETQDPKRAGKNLGGRIISATTTQITVDTPVTIEAGKTYTFKCMLPDGTLATKTITNGVGTTSVFNLSSALATAPNSWAMWVLSVSDLVPEQWRVVSVTEEGQDGLSIVALAYNPSKYAMIEHDAPFQALPTAGFTFTPTTPTNLTLVESLYEVGLGVIGNRTTLSWDSQPYASRYLISYTTLDENEQFLDTTNTSIDIPGLTPGSYTFTVTAINAIGRRSGQAILVADVVGKSAPPADLTNFQVSALGSIGLFTWDQATDLDVLVGGTVVFKYSPNLAATWDTAQFLATTAAGNSTTVTLPLQSGVYFAKFRDSTGNYSVNPTSITTGAAQIIAMNVVEQVWGQPDWLGTKVDTYLDSIRNALVLVSADLWDGADNVDDGVTDELIDFGGGVTDAGTYQLGTVDLGQVLTSRLSTILDFVGVDMFDQWDSSELVDGVENIDGPDISDASASIWYRTTNDDPLGTPTWSSWNQLALADISARALDFELRLVSANPLHNVYVSQATVTVDMPDRVESVNDIISGTGVYSVIYATDFKVAPALAITAQDMATGDYYTITSKSETGFSIRFFNSAGTGISRTFDYIAKGY